MGHGTTDTQNIHLIKSDLAAAGKTCNTLRYNVPCSKDLNQSYILVIHLITSDLATAGKTCNTLRYNVQGGPIKLSQF